MSTESDPKPSSIDDRTKVGVIDHDGCVELLAKTPIGRVAFDADGEILVLPINYRWHENSVVFRTLDGLKLAAAANNQNVCFEIDSWDPTDRSGWSVVVQGTAREVTDWAEEAHLDEIGLVPWAKGAWRTIWVRIHPTSISGRVLV